MPITVLGTMRVVALVMVGAIAARAQQPAEQPHSNADTTGAAVIAQSQLPQPRPSAKTHRFWDRENDLLFVGVGAARALDYSSTLNLRRRGDNEIFLNNEIVDNHPLFIGIEAAATAASIGASYLFHRTGHHRLERWTSIVHIGLTVVGAARNYSLKTVH